MQEWDEQLAVDAGVWAEKCLWWHQTDLGRNGQNLWLGPKIPDGVGAVNSWYNEIRYYDFETNVCEEDKMCGHYLQVNKLTYLDIYYTCIRLYIEDKLCIAQNEEIVSISIK